MAGPFFFVPMLLRHRNGYDCRIVDGELLSNLPVFLFERPGVPPDIPTFGFSLVDPPPSLGGPSDVEGSHQFVALLTHDDVKCT